MQTDESAFEGWCVVLKAAIPEIKQVILNWEDPIYHIDKETTQKAHYMRFIRIRCSFSIGDKVLVIIENEILMPCTFVGSVSKEFFKEWHRKNGVVDEKIIDKFVSDLWDWDWDSVIVRPLVKVKTGFIETSSDTTTQRVYIFPYRELKL